MIEPWVEAPHIWPTKASFFSYLRGAFRRAVWEKWPLKFEFKNSVCEPPPEGYTGRAKTGACCALTGEWTGKSAAEIDHILGNASLQGWEDVVPFLQHLCASVDNMQYVSKEAHKIKSYAEKQGISFEEAAIQKQALSLCKTGQEKEWLVERSVVPATSAVKRRAQVVEQLRKEVNGKK